MPTDVASRPLGFKGLTHLIERVSCHAEPCNDARSERLWSISAIFGHHDPKSLTSRVVARLSVAGLAFDKVGGPFKSKDSPGDACG